MPRPGILHQPGDRIRHWTVLRWAGTGNNREWLWHCRCDCGNEQLICGATLRTGESKVCQRCPRLRKERQPGSARRGYYKQWRRSLREQVIAKYGGCCACCGENQFEFLAVDHVHGGGRKHRQTFDSGVRYHQWLLAEHREGFRVLCHNCNMSHGLYGYCPHELKNVSACAA